MEVYFKDEKVRKVCEQSKEAIKKFGADCAKKLHLRLTQLRAASRVSDLVAGRPHELKGDRKGHYALDLAGGFRLVFAPHHDPIPTHADGSTDWSKVTIVSIEYIGDYHD